MDECSPSKGVCTFGTKLGGSALRERGGQITDTDVTAGSDKEKFVGTLDLAKTEQLKGGLFFIEVENVSAASKQAFARLTDGSEPGKHETFILMGTAAHPVLIGRLSEKPKMSAPAGDTEPEVLTLDYLPLRGYNDFIEDTIVNGLQVRFSRQIQFNPIVHRRNRLEIEILPGSVFQVILQRAA